MKAFSLAKDLSRKEQSFVAARIRRAGHQIAAAGSDQGRQYFSLGFGFHLTELLEGDARLFGE